MKLASSAPAIHPPVRMNEYRYCGKVGVIVSDTALHPAGCILCYYLIRINLKKQFS